MGEGDGPAETEARGESSVRRGRGDAAAVVGGEVGMRG